MIDLLEIKDFLGRVECQTLCAELRKTAGKPATVSTHGTGRTIMPQMRRATRLAAANATRDRIVELLLGHKQRLESHFGRAISECEEPQFLRYQAGDFFVAHQDGNTPGVRDHSRFRKISAVVFLNAQSEEPSCDTYGGGELVFHGPYLGPTLRVPLAPASGTLVCFPAETTHEVVPVTHGERFTIASWYQSTAESGA